MIYVPMLKTRAEELSVAEELSFCFSDNIIPLFEVIVDYFKYEFKKDPVTNDYVYVQKLRRRMREKVPTELITLKLINELVDNKEAFIDYFRYSTNKYGKRVKVAGVSLAFKLSRDEALYKERVKEVSKYKNLIPVVSIKSEFEMSNKDLEKLLGEFIRENDSVGFRITDEFTERYGSLIKNMLRDSDYLLFDIGEQIPSSKVMEFKEIAKLKTRAKIILLNSPRLLSNSNGVYEESGTTALIDNSSVKKYSEYGFDGVGDYCGLKDSLPEGGGNGKGAALALIYRHTENLFYSFLNPDTNLGVAGYYKIIPEILKMKSFFDSSNDCPAMGKIDSLSSRGKCGNWRVWNNITITRYIHQIYRKI